MERKFAVVLGVQGRSEPVIFHVSAFNRADAIIRVVESYNSSLQGLDLVGIDVREVF